LKSKKFFEQFASSVGIKLKKFHADNVPFNSKEFRRNLELNGQPFAFSGTGAHHQNGVAERAIQTVTRWARAMLLHSIMMWPDQADLSLWPFALDHAVYLWNHIPCKTLSLAPVEIFTKTRFPNYNHLRRLHVWGCPVYVLDPALQDGQKLPKWQPRSRRGKFLGLSTTHSTSIGLILNLRTGFVSPQYHVVYDDEFTTVPNSESGGLFDPNRPFDADHWNCLVITGTERLVVSDEDTLPPLHQDWNPPPPPPLLPGLPAVPAPEGDRIQAHRLVNEPAPLERQRLIQPVGPALVPEGAPPIEDFDTPEDFEAPLPPAPPPVQIEPEPTQRTRSGHQVRRPIRLIETMLTQRSAPLILPNAYLNPKHSVRASLYNAHFLMALNWSQAVESLRSADHSDMMHVIDQNTDLEHNTIEWMHPMVLAAKANAEDNHHGSKQ
jgi:hypothetical protein